MADPPTSTSSVLGLNGAQVGDVATGNLVGGNLTEINQAGADPNALLAFISDYVFEVDQRRETEHKRMTARMDDIEERQADNLAIMIDAVRAVRSSVTAVEAAVRALDTAGQAQAARAAADRRQIRLAMIVVAILACAALALAGAHAAGFVGGIIRQVAAALATLAAYGASYE